LANKDLEKDSILLSYKSQRDKALKLSGEELHDFTYKIYREVVNQNPDYETCPMPIGVDRYRWPSHSCYLGTVMGGRHPSPTIEKLILKIMKAAGVVIDERFTEYRKTSKAGKEGK